MFENRVLRRIFEPKRDKVAGEGRKLYKEELNDLYTSPSIVRVIESRRIGWVGHVARMGEKRIQCFRGKNCGKESTWETQAWMGG